MLPSGFVNGKQNSCNHKLGTFCRLSCRFFAELIGQTAPFPVADLRSDKTILPEAFCRYNNTHNYDSSGYSEPADGVSQLAFVVPISEAVPSPQNYSTMAATEDTKAFTWPEPHFQVFAIGNEPPAAVYVVYRFASHPRFR
jgi:hypothetical protein